MENVSMKSLCERPFNPEVTMEQIVSESNFDKFKTWNVHPLIQCMSNDDDECIGMMMKLDHPNYKDFVFITLSWDDTYRVRFFDQRGEEVEDISMLYFDQLFEVIDRRLDKFMRYEVCLN
jgi:hypothetical protein